MIRKNTLNRSRTGNSSNSYSYDTLEIRTLLAGLTPEAVYEPQMIQDPFAFQAVTVEEMSARADQFSYMPGELVVAIELPVASENVPWLLSTFNWSQVTGSAGAQPVSTMMTVDRDGGSSVSLVHLDLGAGADIFVAMHEMDGRVQWSSPNFYSEADPRDFVPNDPFYENQYHHPLIGNESAWDITLGDSNIVIGVTDDGVDLDHVDLQNNIWVNPGEIPGDNIDNDNNGYIDDVNGYDFINGNNDPNPEGGNDHGTHVSGIAAADTDNGVGVAGTAGESTIMPLQWYNGNWSAATNAETFVYATDNGAHIVTTSYNVDGWVGDPVYTAGLQYLYDGGVLHFNSAGNGNSNNSPRVAFHQSLLVVSTDANDERSGFSNYGTGTDISAPGSSIYSTELHDTYGFKSGTSMAAPNAAGAAALIWAANPSWNRDQVAAQLLATADNIDAANPGFEGLLGAGRINTFNALTGSVNDPQVAFVTSLPADGEFLDDTTIDEFTIVFDQVMDPDSVNEAANIDLRAAGLDDVFGTADDVVMDLDASTYMIGTNELMFTMLNGPMNYGHYRLTISSALQNPFGRPLDGDGDGTGGDDYEQEFYISPPTIGNVQFHRNTYQVEDLIEINLGDANAIPPVNVQITTSQGDVETINMNDQGLGNFAASITTTSGAIVTEDGMVQVELDDVITVTYMDPDDGNGNPVNVTDTAVISNILQYESNDVPLHIASNTTIYSDIVIPDVGLVADVDVQIDISHTYTGDLDVYLIAPDDTRVELFTDVGGGGNDFDNTILDDEAGTSIAEGNAPFAGSYRPEGNLSDMDATLINGTWQLEITDDAGGDVGTLHAWSLFIDVRSLDAGVISLDRESYNPGDTIEIAVSDSNAQGPFDVDVTTNAGDVETVTMVDQGGGLFLGSLVTDEGSAIPADGTLQVLPGQVLTATYQDLDNGMGEPDVVTAMANIVNVVQYTSTDIPYAINSNQTIVSELIIDDFGTVADIDVQLDITHTYDGDLDVYLIAPDGTRIELFTDVGGSGNDFDNTILNDEAKVHITDGSAPFAGSYQPEGDLSDVDGIDVNGTWLLEVTDDAGGDTGTLWGWSLFVDLVPADPLVTPDGYKVLRGFHAGGDLNSLMFSDDDHLSFTAGITIGLLDPPVHIELIGTSSVLSPSEMSFTLESSVNTAGLQQTIEVFNYDTGQFEILNQGAASLADATVSTDLAGDLTQYIDDEAGEVRARVSWIAVGPIFLYPWAVNMDLAGWQIVGSPDPGEGVDDPGLPDFVNFNASTEVTVPMVSSLPEPRLPDELRDDLFGGNVAQDVWLETTSISLTSELAQRRLEQTTAAWIEGESLDRFKVTDRIFASFEG